MASSCFRWTVCEGWRQALAADWVGGTSVFFTHTGQGTLRASALAKTGAHNFIYQNQSIMSLPKGHCPRALLASSSFKWAWTHHEMKLLLFFRCTKLLLSTCLRKFGKEEMKTSALGLKMIFCLPRCDTCFQHYHIFLLSDVLRSQFATIKEFPQQ